MGFLERYTKSLVLLFRRVLPSGKTGPFCETLARYFGWVSWNQVLQYSFGDQSGKKVFRGITRGLKRAAGPIAAGLTSLIPGVGPVLAPIAGGLAGGLFGGGPGAALGGAVGTGVLGARAGREQRRFLRGGRRAVTGLLQPFGGQQAAIRGQAEDILTRAGLTRGAGPILAALGGLQLEDVRQRRALAAPFIEQPFETGLQAGLTGAGGVLGREGFQFGDLFGGAPGGPLQGAIPAGQAPPVTQEIFGGAARPRRRVGVAGLRSAPQFRGL